MGLIEKIMNPKFKDLIKTISWSGLRFYYIQTPPEQTRPHFIPKGGGIGDFHYDRKNPVYKDEREFYRFFNLFERCRRNDGSYAFILDHPKKPLGFEKIVNVYGKAGTLIASRLVSQCNSKFNKNRTPSKIAL